MTHDASTTLECGHDLLELVEQVTDGAIPADPEHQANCPYCQEALCRLRAANGQLRALAGERVDVPRGLTRRVMAQLRRERGRVPLASSPAGADTASDLVIVQIARRAARSIEGVRNCSVTLDPVEADGILALTIHLTAVLGPSLPELTEQVRAAVVADLLALAGLQAGAVAVVVDDVDLPD